MTIANQPATGTRQAEPPPRVRRYRSPVPVNEPKARISSAIIYIVVAVLITAVGLLYLIQTNHVAGLGYEMSQLQRERTVLSNRNEQLNYALAGYESLNQIESIAIGQIGMQDADSTLFIDVPRPASDQLDVPDVTTSVGPSLLERVWNGLTGSSVAVSANREAGP